MVCVVVRIIICFIHFISSTFSNASSVVWVLIMMSETTQTNWLMLLFWNNNRSLCNRLLFVFVHWIELQCFALPSADSIFEAHTWPSWLGKCRTGKTRQISWEVWAYWQFATRDAFDSKYLASCGRAFIRFVVCLIRLRICSLYLLVNNLNTNLKSTNVPHLSPNSWFLILDSCILFQRNLTCKKWLRNSKN